MAEISLTRLARMLEEPAYVAVGFGVLGFQRAQVARRDLRRRVSLGRSGTSQAGPAPSPHESRAPEQPAQLPQMAQRLGEVAQVASVVLRPLVVQAADRASQRLAPLVNDAASRFGERAGEAVQHLPPEAHEFLEAAGDLAKDIPGEARQLAKEVVSLGTSAFNAWVSGARR